MALTINEIKQVAFQIRLLFTDEEVSRATDSINASVARNNVFDRVATDHVEPLFFGNAKQNVFRDDVVGQSLPIETTMQNAPKHDGDCFLFPAVLG